jgi:hypothetical protein
MAAAIAWLSSDRGLLVVGTSLVLGALGYVWVDCLRLWRVRRKARDGVDLAATTLFTGMIGSIALVLRTYDSLPAASVGVACAAVSYAGLRRALRLTTG